MGKINKIGNELVKLSFYERFVFFTGGNRLLILTTLPFPIFVVFGLDFLITGADRNWYVWLFTVFCLFAGVWIYRSAQRYVQKNARYGVLFGEMLQIAQVVSVVAAIVFGVIFYYILINDHQLVSSLTSLTHTS